MSPSEPVSSSAGAGDTNCSSGSAPAEEVEGGSWVGTKWKSKGSPCVVLFTSEVSMLWYSSSRPWITVLSVISPSSLKDFVSMLHLRSKFNRFGGNFAATACNGDHWPSPFPQGHPKERPPVCFEGYHSWCGCLLLAPQGGLLLCYSDSHEDS